MLLLTYDPTVQNPPSEWVPHHGMNSDDALISERRVLPILMDRSPMPDIPRDFKPVILGRKRIAKLRGRLQRDGGICPLCGCRARKGNVDHMIPKSRGGVSTETNLMLTCGRCNSLKGSRTSLEFAADTLRAMRLLRKRFQKRQPVFA